MQKYAYALLALIALVTLCLALQRFIAPPEVGKSSHIEARWTQHFVYVGKEVRVEVASAPQYELPLDLSRVRCLEYFKLSPRARELLAKNGFVVVPGTYLDLAGYYEACSRRGILVFITTDSVLYVYHVYFLKLLRKLEEEKLAPRLKALLSSLVGEADSLARFLPQGSLARRAAEHDVAYLSVALKLLDPEFKPPPYVVNLVGREIKLIEAAAATTLALSSAT